MPQGNGSSQWKIYEKDPLTIVDGIKSDEVQNTSLNSVGGEGVSGTLESITDHLTVYIDWTIYLGLSVASILIIYNGFMLVIKSSDDAELGNVKKRLKYLFSGILLLTGFYLLIKLVASLVETLT